MANGRGWARNSDPTFGAVVGLIDGDEDKPAAADPNTVVYFLLDPDACQIKIGWTKDFSKRLRSHSRKRPNLTVLGTLQGGYDLERAMHGRFRAHRVGAQEWYSSEIAAEVLSLLRFDASQAA